MLWVLTVMLLVSICKTQASISYIAYIDPSSAPKPTIECNVSKDGRCGMSFGKTSCPNSDQHCSQNGQCCTIDEDKIFVKTAYDYRPECSSSTIWYKKFWIWAIILTAIVAIICGIILFFYCRELKRRASVRLYNLVVDSA